MSRVLSVVLAQNTRTRHYLRIAVDCALWVVALYAAVLLRLDFDPARVSTFMVASLLPAAWIGQCGFGYLCGLYRG